MSRDPFPEIRRGFWCLAFAVDFVVDVLRGSLSILCFFFLCLSLYIYIYTYLSQTVSLTHRCKASTAKAREAAVPHFNREVFVDLQGREGEDSRFSSSCAAHGHPRGLNSKG